jgi:hypothetical protein
MLQLVCTSNKSKHSKLRILRISGFCSLPSWQSASHAKGMCEQEFIFSVKKEELDIDKITVYFPTTKNIYIYIYIQIE